MEITSHYADYAKKFHCVACDYSIGKKSSFDKHLLTAKHKLLTDQTPKVARIFNCQICDYTTVKKSSYDNHLLSAKHISLTILNEKAIKSCSTSLTCAFCNKIYKSRVGLWSHKKKCTQPQLCISTTDPVLENTLTPPVNDVSAMPAFDMNLVLELLKQNQEFKDLLLEQNKQLIDQHQSVMVQNQNMIELTNKVGNTTNNNINNQQNNNFNLNVFLNETCKDAVCINDFIKDLPVSFQQLENIGQNGYVAGITEVIISYLKTMEVAERPLHCTDTKRDTMYIKEMNKWVKDDDNNTKMTRIFRTIANKNLRTIRKWAEEHPLSQESNTKENSFCTDVMLNSLGAIGDDQIKYDNKVLKTIAKFVHVGRNL
jgi:hypothetical protein